MEYINKEQVIQEYFQEEISFRRLAQRHGVTKQRVWNWVRKYKAIHGITTPNTGRTSPISSADNACEAPKALERSQLEVKLLNEIIDVAEKEYGISIRKKYGTKQS